LAPSLQFLGIYLGAMLDRICTRIGRLSPRTQFRMSRKMQILVCFPTPISLMVVELNEMLDDVLVHRPGGHFFGIIEVGYKMFFEIS
jgi:hypothetical protein